MDGISKMCRFCLQQEHNEFSLIHIFSYNSENLCKQIRACFGIVLKPVDMIPPLICRNCLKNIESLYFFIEKVKKSETILFNIYSPQGQIANSTDQTEHTSEEIIKNSPKNDVDVAYLDDIMSCDSDSELNNCDKQIKTKNIRPDSPMPDMKSQEAALYFPGGKRVNLVNINETVEKTDQVNNYVCSICCKMFNSFFEYHDHQSTHDGQLVFCCSKCDKVFTTRKELVEHENGHKIPCDVCNVEVLPKYLLAHKKKHTDQYKCTKCQSRHTSKALLEQHYKARHLNLKGNVCHICGKQNSCQSSMKRHIASHMSARPFKCVFCNFSSKSRAVLQVHIQRKHSNQRIVCEICAKIFKSELSLRQHIKRYHAAKKFECNVCNKCFSEKSSLDKHILKKHTKQRLYECKLCKIEFGTVRELKDHMHSHRPGCESCPGCGKIFFYKKMLQKHLEKCVPQFKENVYEMKGSLSLPNTTVSFDE